MVEQNIILARYLEPKKHTSCLEQKTPLTEYRASRPTQGESYFPNTVENGPRDSVDIIINKVLADQSNFPKIEKKTFDISGYGPYDMG